MDYESERAIQQNMKRIAAGRTVFVVAHRLSTVRQADRIITIERGRIVEDGNHDDLIRSTDGTQSCITFRRESMTSGNKNIVAFPRAEITPPRGRNRVPASGARDHGDASLAGRARDRGEHRRRLLRRTRVGVAWQVDIVTTSTGKIVPGGRTKLIQPFETGVVRAIHVRDGQTVKAGDVLIELDPTMTGADEERQKSDLAAPELDVARLQRGTRRRSACHLPSAAGRKPRADRDASSIPGQRAAEQDAKLSDIGRQQSQKEAERATTSANVAKIQATIPVLQERVDIHKTLLDKGLASKVVYLPSCRIWSASSRMSSCNRASSAKRMRPLPC